MALRKHQSVILDSTDGSQPNTYEVLDVDFNRRLYTLQELRSMQKSTITFDEATERHATILNS